MADRAASERDAWPSRTGRSSEGRLHPRPWDRRHQLGSTPSVVEEHTGYPEHDRTCPFLLWITVYASMPGPGRCVKSRRYLNQVNPLLGRFEQTLDRDANDRGPRIVP